MTILYTWSGCMAVVISKQASAAEGCSQARKLTLSPSAPSCRVLEPLSSTRSPHLQAPSQFSRTCISPSSTLPLEERKPGTDYSLQTTNLHTASPSKGLFFFSPMLDEALRRIEDFSRLTLHFIMHHIGISKKKKPKSIKQTNKNPLKKLRLAIHLVCILHAPPPQVFKGGHFQYFRFVWDE